MNCTCNDWKENMHLIDAPRSYLAARNPGTWDYTGRQFVFCPWCAKLLESEPAPIDILLYCPLCSVQHIDKESKSWSNPPHKTHECQNCGHLWRPSDVPTNGIAEIKTKGKRDGFTQPHGPFPLSTTNFQQKKEDTTWMAGCDEQTDPFV